MPDPVVITQAGPVRLLDVPTGQTDSDTIGSGPEPSAYSVLELIDLRDAVANALPGLMLLSANTHFVRFHTRGEHDTRSQQVEQGMAALEAMLQRLNV